MDMHMSASLRNEYKSFQKRDKKPIENPIMNMGGIGMGYGVPPRMNPPTFIGMNQPLEGFTSNMVNPNLGMSNAPMGIMNPNLPIGMGPNFGMGMNSQLATNNRMPPQPPNFRTL